MRAPSVSRRLRWMLGLVGITMGVVLMAGVGWATILQEEVSYHGCYGNDGYLRVVQPGADCKKNETSITWNQTGPRGLTGQPGAPGTARAYAAISGDGWINPARSRNIASVIHGATGSYCIWLTPEAYGNGYLTALATPTGGTMQPRYAAIVMDCGADGKGIHVAVFNSAGQSVDADFYMLVP